MGIALGNIIGLWKSAGGDYGQEYCVVSVETSCCYGLCIHGICSYYCVLLRESTSSISTRADMVELIRTYKITIRGKSLRECKEAFALMIATVDTEFHEVMSSKLRDLITPTSLEEENK